MSFLEFFLYNVKCSQCGVQCIFFCCSLLTVLEVLHLWWLGILCKTLWLSSVWVVFFFHISRNLVSLNIPSAFIYVLQSFPTPHSFVSIAPIQSLLALQVVWGAPFFVRSTKIPSKTLKFYDNPHEIVFCVAIFSWQEM